MSENPYQSPETMSPAVGVLSGSREDVRSVAVYQKAILICILVYLLAFLAQITLALTGALTPPLQLILGILGIGVGIVGAVFVFLLAIKVYGTALGILLGILALVPLIGLIVLLVVNGKATNILRQNGIDVGLLGADIKSI